MSILATDAFTRANSGNLGANWTDMAQGSQFTISSNQAVPSAFSGSDSYSYYSAISWPNDQYSKADLTCVGTGGGSGIGLGVRDSGTATTLSTYFFSASHDGTGQAYWLRKFVGGSFSEIVHSGGSWTDGDTHQLQAQGTTLKIFRLGTEIVALTSTDSSLSSGSAGIAFSTTETSALVDNWEGGDFAGQDTPELYGRPDGLGGQRLMSQLLAQ